jgi:archaemetzincin
VNAIYLLPLGMLDEGIVATIDQGVRRTFRLAVRQLRAEETPGYAYDAARRQYSSELILRAIIKRTPENALRLLAVTGVDLFIPMLTFVYGQAQLNGKVSVVSTARMHQEFYSLPGNQKLTLSRIAKESIHELGHTFGLTHCSNPSCPMSIATGLEQLDAKGDLLCDGCVGLLHDTLSDPQRTFMNNTEVHR